MYEEYPPSEYMKGKMTKYKYKLTIKARGGDSYVQEKIHEKLVQVLRELVDETWFDQFELEWN